MENSAVKKIDFCDVGGFRVGNAQNYEAMTGVTALVFDKKNVCGVDIRGGGPAARENFLFSPLSYQQSVTALLLSGGSAYGLASADGAMKYCEEHDMGYRLKNIVVPIVPQSCIFDLGIGSSKVRPDSQMGYDACKNAEGGKNSGAISGNAGAGTGATVGKIFGMLQAQKSGIGYSAVQCGKLKVGAVIVVNALGDIFDFRTAQKIAGAVDAERKNFLSVEETLCASAIRAQEGMNTTIGAVVMNGKLSQQELCKVAAMTRAAFGRSINPVGTTADGDTMYAVSTGDVPVDVNAAGALACRVVSEAIIDAVKSARMDDEEFISLVKKAAL